MTIPSETNKSGPYFYNGATTSFAYGFKISDETHIRVVETVTATGVETDLVLGVDYTVTGVGDDTGTFVISPARAAGKTVLAVREVPFTQQIVLENQGAYFAKVVEGALDNSVARDQQLQEQIDRAIKVSVSSDLSPDELIADLTAGSAAAVAAAVSTAADAVQTAADRVQTGADRTQTGLDRIATAADAVATAADRVQTGLDAAAVATNKGLVDTAKAAVDVAKAATDANVVLTAADVVSAEADRVATAADRVQTGLDRVQTGLDRVAAAASAASINVTALDTRRNRIVNGDMRVSQENGTTSGTTNGRYPVDQWAQYFVTSAGTLTVAQVASVTPAGSPNRLRGTVTVADASLAAGEYWTLTQNLEGSNVADFRYGSASARAGVLRFGFKGPAGTYAARIGNSAANRSYVALFTITGGQANTDTVQTIAITGDVTGTWLTADGVIGMTLEIVLACGSTFRGATGWQAGLILGTAAVSNGMGTGAAVFELFDVGLKLDPDATGVYGAYEVGETDAVYRPLRYKWRLYSTGIATPVIANGFARNSTNAFAVVDFPGLMCKAPTFSYAGSLYFASNADVSLGGTTAVQAGRKSAQLQGSTTGLTAGYGGILSFGLAAGAGDQWIDFNARLS